MKKLLFVFPVLFILLSCDNDNNNIYITTYTVDIDNKLDTISKVDSDYFEIRISQTNDSLGNMCYVATRDLEKSNNPFLYKWITITNKKGELIYFKSSTDFLNFMSQRKYDLADQHPNKYGNSYTFKRE